jgi:hypothetical protein
MICLGYCPRWLCTSRPACTYAILVALTLTLTFFWKSGSGRDPSTSTLCSVHTLQSRLAQVSQHASRPLRPCAAQRSESLCWLARTSGGQQPTTHHLLRTALQCLTWMMRRLPSCLAATCV